VRKAGAAVIPLNKEPDRKKPAGRTRRELAKQGDAILKRARCNTMTGAVKDKHYRRNKRAENERLARHWRAKRKKYGKLGAASPVRTIPPDGCAEMERDRRKKPSAPSDT
jgi:hypothetical protein